MEDNDECPVCDPDYGGGALCRYHRYEAANALADDSARRQGGSFQQPKGGCAVLVLAVAAPVLVAAYELATWVA